MTLALAHPQSPLFWLSLSLRLKLDSLRRSWLNWWLWQPPSWLKSLLAGLGLVLAVGIRNTSTNATSATATSLTFSVPTGTVDNDVMYVSITIRGGTNETISITGGAGAWTLINRTNGSTAIAHAVYRRVASGESGDYTVSWTNANNCAISCISLTGVDTGTPEDATATGQANSSSTSVTAPTLTTVTDNAFLLHCGGCQGARTFTAPTTPGTWTRQTNISSTAASNNMTDSISTTTFSPAGATGAVTATIDVAQNNVGILVPVRPSADALIQDAMSFIGVVPWPR